METAVRAVDVSKHYDIYRRPIDRLIELLTRRPRHVVFPALEGVSFDVEKGETVGIIGQNGAGKSTLLKLLCGVTQPSSGTLETHGTIASILELGTGFHPEFSGRDNAALNAAILGLTPSEVRERLPAILEFSELGSFLDRPVKTYSSGMYMRLAFSVAVNVDPDILVIDEALAVGDGHFQKKCIDKIREFQEAGKTILFCSHALYYISLDLPPHALARSGTGDALRPVARRRARVRDVPARARPRASRARGAAPQTQYAGALPRDRRLRSRRRCRATASRAARTSTCACASRPTRPTQPVHVIVGVHRAADDLQCFAVGTHADGIAPLSGRTEYEITVRLHERAAAARRLLDHRLRRRRERASPSSTAATCGRRSR